MPRELGVNAADVEMKILMSDTEISLSILGSHMSGAHAVRVRVPTELRCSVLASVTDAMPLRENFEHCLGGLGGQQCYNRQDRRLCRHRFRDELCAALVGVVSPSWARVVDVHAEAVNEDRAGRVRRQSL